MQRIEGSDEIQASYCITNIVDALRELIENAMDAKATQIFIQVLWAPLNVIVQDNGIGISEFEYIGQQACTTKAGYGFRGVSLLYLRQLSERMSIVSRGDFLVQRKEFDKDRRGKITIEPSSLRGTIVRVDGLFSRYPLRRKLMKSERLEPKIRKMISERWLFRHDISFKYRSESFSFELPKRKSLVDALKFLNPSHDEYEKIGWDREGIRLHGIVSTQPTEMPHQFLRIVR
jgi:DNA mismatch repair ATPase MutL